MADAGFNKVGKSDKRMYGPTGALACGFGTDGRKKFLAMLKKKGVALPVIFAATGDGEQNLKSIFARPAGSGIGDESRMPCAVILSGITENQLHLILAGYRDAGLPKTLWATLTPISESWALKELLSELEKEHASMQKRRDADR